MLVVLVCVEGQRRSAKSPTAAKSPKPGDQTVANQAGGSVAGANQMAAASANDQLVSDVERNVLLQQQREQLQAQLVLQQQLHSELQQHLKLQQEHHQLQAQLMVRSSSKKGKGRYSSSWEPRLRAMGRHLPYGITQCYLPPNTSERAPPYLSHTGW